MFLLTLSLTVALLTACIGKLLAVTPALNFTLWRRKGFRHVLTDNDTVDGCLSLRHEIRTAAGHLECAPNTGPAGGLL